MKTNQPCFIIISQLVDMIEDDLCAIGFMFDAEHSREVREISFASNIKVSLRTIGDKPGHVQSGQYLWPAATAAGNYLIENWEEVASDQVLELGAGCGLAGIVAFKLPGVQHVVWTDYDRGSLQLITENVDDNCSFGSYHIHFLEWGKRIGEDVRQENAYPTDGFRLVVGSDLIYCKEVIEPLFRTVAEVLHREGIFVLISSFGLEADFEATIDSICRTLAIKRDLRIKLDETNGVSKVEHFAFTH